MVSTFLNVFIMINQIIKDFIDFEFLSKEMIEALFDLINDTSDVVVDTNITSVYPLAISWQSGLVNLLQLCLSLTSLARLDNYTIATKFVQATKTTTIDFHTKNEVDGTSLIFIKV